MGQTEAASLYGDCGTENRVLGVLKGDFESQALNASLSFVVDLSICDEVDFLAQMCNVT